MEKKPDILFEQIKKNILMRVAGRLDETALKAVASSLEDYQEIFTHGLAENESRTASLREENDVLRSLLGLGETELRSKIVELSEEARFLRERAAASAKELEALTKEKDGLKLESEERKNEIERGHHLREAEQKKFASALEELQKQLAAYGQKMSERDGEREREKLKLEADVRTLEMKARRETGERVTEELRVSFNRFAEAATRLTDTADEGRARLAAVRKAAGRKAPVLARLSGKQDPKLAEVLTELENSFDRLLQESAAAAEVLRSFRSLLETPEVKREEVALAAVKDELSKKVSSLYPGRNIKFEWPAGTAMKAVTDRRVLVEICEILLRNAAESIPPKGEIRVSAALDGQRLSVAVSDNGTGVKPELRSRLFTPFFTTKSEHRGMGLARAVSLARSLDGTIEYRPLEPGSAFTVSVPA